MKQSPRAWFDKFSTVIAHYELRRNSSEYSIFVGLFSIGTIILAVYVDDIVITRDDHQCIIQLKVYLSSHFYIKNLDLLRSFLGIDGARSLKGLSQFQRKYFTNLLEETDTLESTLWILIFVLIKT